MNLSIIVAIATNNVIGSNNKLIWHISEDLKRFKQITMGAPVILGRKTYESIGKALPGRINIVISANTNYKADKCVVVHSLEDAIRYAQQLQQDEIFIIGGARIYQQALAFVNKLYITHIEKEYEGDSFFPAIDYSKWNQVNKESFERGSKFEYPFSFTTYLRKE